VRFGTGEALANNKTIFIQRVGQKDIARQSAVFILYLFYLTTTSGRP